MSLTQASSEASRRLAVRAGRLRRPVTRKTGGPARASTAASVRPMTCAMQKQSVRAHRILVTHAPQDALAPITRLILGRLGYAILMPEEFEEVSQTLERPRPDLRIVDERSLAELPEDESPPVP